MAKAAVVAATAVLAGLMAGCQMEETRIVHKGSIEQQFAQLNKGGWSVESGDSREKRAQKPEEMRVVREANFGNLQVHTNFQIDDPKLRAEQEKRDKEEAAKRGPVEVPVDSSPEGAPFGTLMPGR